MSTVVEPPPTRPQPSPDELEALIEEARRRQRRRRLWIGGGLLVVLAAAGVVAYSITAREGGGAGSLAPSRRPAAAATLRGDIVFAANRIAVDYGEIYRVDADGHRVDLSRSPAEDFAPAVSPDGKWVAFLSDRSSGAALYVVRIDGSDLRRLSPLLSHQRSEFGRDAWSPDGRQIAFKIGQAGPFVTTFPGGKPKSVRSVPWLHASPYRTRLVSFDGTRVASWRPVGSSRVAATWKLTVDGRAIARSRPCARDWGSPFGNVQFVPGGRSLVYAAICDEPTSEVYAMAPDGSGLRPLTHALSDLSEPAVSPDGRRIAFVLSDQVPCKGCSPSIWTMDATGGHQRELTFPREQIGEADGGPSWSPGGKRIVFSRFSSTSPEALYIVPARGGRPHPLHVLGSRPSWGVAGIIYLGDDTIWSVMPDGSARERLAAVGRFTPLAVSSAGRLAYSSDPDGHSVSILGRKRETLRTPLFLTYLTWSPDGQRLLVAGGRPNELYVLDPGTRRLRQLTSGMGWISGMAWR